MNNYTLVSGLWNIGRDERNFKSHYLAKFEEFLQIEANMILFLPKELEEFVWKYRKPENTFIKITELEDLKTNLYAPHWDNTQGIRNLKDLPDNAKRYIHALEDFVGARISSISTSPERDDTILVEDPFQI